MADITMCTQTLCPNAKHCYRMCAAADKHWQAYDAFDYAVSDDGVICEYYIPTNNDRHPNSIHSS